MSTPRPRGRPDKAAVTSGASTSGTPVTPAQPSPDPTPTPPATRFDWACDTLGGNFRSPAVEAAFWQWFLPAAAKLDAATALINGGLLLLASILAAFTSAYPGPTIMVPGLASVALAGAIAGRGWPSARFRVSALVATRVATAVATTWQAWLRAIALLPPVVPPMRRQSSGRVLPVLALVLMPRTWALALPAVGFVLPPRANVVASALSMATVMTAFKSSVIAREAYFGRDTHVQIAGALSAATRALFDPLAPAPAPVSTRHVTLYVTWLAHAVEGLVVPFVVTRAWLQGARARFRKVAGPAHVVAHHRDEAAGWDSVVLGVAATALTTLVMWRGLEMLDAALGAGK